MHPARIILPKLLAVTAALPLAVMPLADAEPGAAYLPDWGSLARHQEAPEWFRDAKFGIYFHWGVYSVPAFGHEWYPRWMHFEGRPEYAHHLKVYGHPSKFGYHDFVPMFRAEHFDADEWASLFKAAGARFAGPVAEHHDGFAMWDSDVTPWNAMDMGPKRDITGEIAAAVRKRGMKLVTSFHHARNLQRYQKPPGQENATGQVQQKLLRESHYPYDTTMPTASEDPKLRLLYGNMDEQEWLRRMWLGKLHEVMDRYQPDLIWFDSWLNEIPESYRQRFCADYLNRARDWGKEVVITRKQEDLPVGVSLEDFEQGRLDRLTESCWLTDDTLSKGRSWSYIKGLKIKPTREVLHSLIDIVSKNGCLLLNISPMADGTIPDDQRQVLREMGAWLDVNGEAIYETRPWSSFGEGPTRLARGGGFIDEVTYTPEDIRYTRSKDGRTLYAILLGWPGAGKIATLGLINPNHIQIKDITLLGSREPVKWQLTANGLELTMPEHAPSELALVLRIDKSFE